MSTHHSPRKLGLLVGGGPAPGINGVISSVTIEAIEQGMEVIGFQDGFKWLIKGMTDQCRRLEINDVTRTYLRGGSILGTARANPAKSEVHMRNVLSVFEKLGITDLVTIGGDDTAYSGSQVHLHAGGRIRVAHVPKTIDNDLPLDTSMPTFGFETARHVGVNIVRSLAEDARTTGRWYLVVSMGRAAGHLALGIGKAAAATLTIIPEEFEGRQTSLDELSDIVIGSMIKRQVRGRHNGVAILAEGLIEKIPIEELKAVTGEVGRYGRIIFDDHGHLRLGEIEFGRMMRDRISERLKELHLDVSMIDKEIGYELRSADPIPFDAEYTRDLGYGAVSYLLSEEAEQHGAIISLDEGRMRPLLFDELPRDEKGRLTTRRVDLNGIRYACARRYMIRLEPSDFDTPAKLNALADCVHMQPEGFQKRFGYVVGK